MTALGQKKAVADTLVHYPKSIATLTFSCPCICHDATSKPLTSLIWRCNVLLGSRYVVDVNMFITLVENHEQWNGFYTYYIYIFGIFL